MIDEKKRDAVVATAVAILAALAVKTDSPRMDPNGSVEDFERWAFDVLAEVNGRMVRAVSQDWPQPINQTVDGITVEHYRDSVGDLSAALVQHVAVSNGEPQKGCAICGHRSHVADDCSRNPLLLMAFGAHALHGPTWKCFHCGAVFSDERGAADHFGDRLENAARCVREQAQILTYRAEQLTALRAKCPEISDDLARAASALREVRAWLVRARS